MQGFNAKPQVDLAKERGYNSYGDNRDNQVVQRKVDTRFLSFEEKHIIIVKYLGGAVKRDFKAFSTIPGEKSRPLPEVVWDSMITYKRSIEDL